MSPAFPGKVCQFHEIRRQLSWMSPDLTQPIGPDQSCLETMYTPETGLETGQGAVQPIPGPGHRSAEGLSTQWPEH